jgi:hypothetical protein
MRPVVLRFVAVAVVFAAWIAYLGYLVLMLPKSPNGLPPILSRPQFLVSDLDVVGEIDDDERTVPISELLNPSNAEDLAALAGVAALQAPSPKVHVVKVDEVLYPPNATLPAGRIIGVTNFNDCRIPGTSGEPPKPTVTPLPAKLSQLGACLLALRSLDGGLTWQVVPLPPSPGFQPPAGYEKPRIYPADAETRAQYKQIGKQ